MNCRAWRGVKASPLRNVSVWSRRERIASTSSARPSARVVPSSGRSPRRPSRPGRCPPCFSAALCFLRLLRLRGFEGGLLRHADGQAGSAVGPRALPADLLARLVAHALVRSDHLHQVDVVPQPYLDVGTERVEVESRLPVFRPVHHPMRERLPEVAEGRLDLVRILLREVAEAFRPRDAGEVDDGLGDADPDAGDRGERVRDGPRAVEVRVRHPDDVPEVLLDALELLRRAGRFRLLFRLFPLPRGPLALPGLRRGRWGFGFRAWLLLTHR